MADIYLVTNPSAAGTASLIITDANNNQIPVAPGSSIPILLSATAAGILAQGLGNSNVIDISNPSTQSSDSAEGTQADSPWTGTGNGSMIAILKGIYNLLTADEAVQTAVVIETGVTVTAGAGLGIYCTSAGTFTIQMAGGGSPVTFPMNVGYSQLPFAITEVVSVTGEATFMILNT